MIKNIFDAESKLNGYMMTGFLNIFRFRDVIFQTLLALVFILLFNCKSDRLDDTLSQCSELGASWVEGTANFDGFKYDLSNCKRSSPRMAEIVSPAMRSSKWEKARCNDGSPFRFELNLSEKKNVQDWVIIMQGGFLCNDDDLIAPCFQRSKQLSSSLNDAGDRELINPSKREGIFSTDPNNNPTFSSMNLVYARYCSSDLWTGSTTTPKTTSGGDWYFSGRENVKAMIEILKERYGLDDEDPETRVLFMGQSAGGIGAIANIDQLIDLLPKTASSGRLKLATDGGGFTHFKDDNYKLLGKMFLDEFAESNYNFFSSKMNPSCEGAEANLGNHPSECLFISSVYPSIQSQGIPFLVVYSLHDEEILDKHGIDPILDKDAYDKLGEVTVNDFKDIPWLFAGDQPYHIITTNDQIWNTKLLGVTLNEIFTKFWNDDNPVRVIP